ncbi:MAG: hypothetical protein Unbinned4585contig1001_23 [Prokaryotic dsDNA virus sp.]|nr:MAG: hypothetical protein Unbinned4585contig1001_23 [Prokaryotic dsDNA virus sp.]|tara:strand:- start:1940 stop:2083 length:144 start_codon:yes stop_codon:yes gene_type:complete
MREIIEELKCIWIKATYPRIYKVGKYILKVAPFSITILKNHKIEKRK